MGLRNLASYFLREYRANPPLKPLFWAVGGGCVGGMLFPLHSVYFKPDVSVVHKDGLAGHQNVSETDIRHYVVNKGLKDKERLKQDPEIVKLRKEIASHY